ncbi:superoxide dismutase family protein [Brevibacillus massiliensis]|uniref:superoxide dismutase family protein n=1 Tax=Brevibacillus massiliensis TaxID=1118054 RepID=UPI0002D86C08|nr:superoxide dismutase family protein [Brevibacillus massiliensis]
MKKIWTLAAAALLVGIGAWMVVGKTQPVIREMPEVQIVSAKGEKIGTATLTEEGGGVKLRIKASQLPPGKHGFHIHESSFQGQDFKAAGAHFNPYGKKHGFDNPEGHHLGDMPNLTVKPDGTVDTEVMLNNATLKKGEKNSLLGKSIIIHSGEDDGKTDPAGNSGDRIAGGVIAE